MGIVRDWSNENSDYIFRRRVIYFLSPRVWLRLHKWRKQRADRGWSDRDTWAAGEYIAKITAEMLQHLNDNTYVDWKMWFKLNVDDNMGYKNLQSAINDINNYLDFINNSWADGLSTIPSDNPEHFNVDWVDSSGHVLTSKEITRHIKKYRDKEDRLYAKATRAMQFFGRNFSSFWD